MPTISRFRWLSLLLLSGSLLGSLAGCQRSGDPEPRGVVLIVLDTLRADRVSAYGNPRLTSPNLDRLAAEGVLFERAYSNASWTLPGFVGLLAGSYPSARVFQGRRLERSLVETLRDAGFATGAATEGGYVSTHFGIDRGFDSFESHEGKIKLQGPRVAQASDAPGGLATTFASASDWLRAHAKQRFFLMVHTYEVHMPYLDRSFAEGLPRGALGEAYSFEDAGKVIGKEMVVGDIEIEYVRALYDGGLAAADVEVGKLLALLDELGIADTTLVAVTADHGEELGERSSDRLGAHGTALYDSLLHVPLILRDPTREQLAGRRVPEQVRLIDVMPTVLDLVGVEVPPGTSGRSLVPLLDGTEQGDRPVYAEVLDPKSTTPRVRRIALRDGRFKLIANAPPLPPGERVLELYDVTADPTELDNLADREPERRESLSKALRAQRESIEREGVSRSQGDALEEDAKERLRALGYAE